MKRFIVALALLVLAAPAFAQNVSAPAPSSAERGITTEIDAWTALLGRMRHARGATASTAYTDAETAVVAIIDSLRSGVLASTAAAERNDAALSTTRTAARQGALSLAGLDTRDLLARVQQRTALAGGAILLAIAGFGIVLSGLLQRRRERRALRPGTAAHAGRNARLWTARTLAQTGHEPAEIARTVGMPRDAVNLLRHRKMTPA